MKKLLIICGQTATGKTQLALELAYKFSGELVSADSRQVYKGLSIITGKDIPKNFSFRLSHCTFLGRNIGYFRNGTRIWLTDLCDLDEEFSAAVYHQAATTALDDIQRRNHLPIVVGGTGLYLQAITQKIPTLHVPPDKQLRLRLAKVSTFELQKKLQRIDRERWEKMNASDRANPRRLIRALEIASFVGTPPTVNIPSMDTLWIGLTAPLPVLEKRIAERVEKRWESGAVDEVRQIIRHIRTSDTPPRTAIGVSPLVAYLRGELSQAEAIQRWVNLERQYARRQRTWFAKQPYIRWFDITDKQYKGDVAQVVQAWYTGHTDDVKN